MMWVGRETRPEGLMFVVALLWEIFKWLFGRYMWSTSGTDSAWGKERESLIYIYVCMYA